MVSTEEKQAIISGLLQRIRVTEDEAEVKACTTAIRILLRENDKTTDDALTEEVSMLLILTQFFSFFSKCGNCVVCAKVLQASLVYQQQRRLPNV